MFYYLLGNVQPKYRSQLKAIQLVAVANSAVVDTIGVDAVLEPLVKDIKRLEKVTDKVMTWYHESFIHVMLETEGGREGGREGERVGMSHTANCSKQDSHF